MRPESTIEQLRSDIDHGHTGDKVYGSDPAAAPLGADEEAAGTPISAKVITDARQAEGAKHSYAPRPNRGLGAAWVLVLFAVTMAVGLVTWVLLR
jgi:hypothetical protein